MDQKEITLIMTLADLFVIRKALDESLKTDIFSNEERQTRGNLLTWFHTDFPSEEEKEE